MSFFGYRRPTAITPATTTAPAAQEHAPPYAGKIHTHAVPTYGSGQGYGTHERHRAVCLVCGVELVWYGVEFCGEFTVLPCDRCGGPMANVCEEGDP